MKQDLRSPVGLKVNGQMVQLGEGATIDDEVILGYISARKVDQFLSVGPGAHLRRGTIIYSGSRIGSNLETGHNVVIREENVIGDNFRIWNNSVVDYGCRIGNNVKVHNKVYVAQYTVIEDEVFIAPGVTLANDMHPGCPNADECMLGPHIKRGAQIGINCTLLPRVVVGEFSVIGAGSVITRDIPPRVVAYGNPAKVVCDIGNLICTTGLRDKPYENILKGI